MQTLAKRVTVYQSIYRILCEECGQKIDGRTLKEANEYLRKHKIWKHQPTETRVYPEPGVGDR